MIGFVLLSRNYNRIAQSLHLHFKAKSLLLPKKQVLASKEHKNCTKTAKANYFLCSFESSLCSFEAKTCFSGNKTYYYNRNQVK